MKEIKEMYLLKHSDAVYLVIKLNGIIDTEQVQEIYEQASGDGFRIAISRDMFKNITELVFVCSTLENPFENVLEWLKWQD